MVKVYYLRQSEKVDTSDLAEPAPIIRKLTKDDPSKFGFKYCGKMIDHEKLSGLKENDCLRIVPLPESDIPTISNEENMEIENILNKVAKFVAQYGSPVFEIYHNESSAGDHVKKFLNLYPKIRDDPEALTALTDFHIFHSYCHTERTDEERNAWLRKHPQAVFVIDKILDHLINSVYSGQFAPMRVPHRHHPQPQQQQQQQAPQPVITQMDLQSALAMALGQVPVRPAGASNQAPPAPAAAPQPAPVQPQPVPDYTAQLAQLKDFGFQDEALCRLALEQTGGDIQSALEMIVNMME